MDEYQYRLLDCVFEIHCRITGAILQPAPTILTRYHFLKRRLEHWRPSLSLDYEANDNAIKALCATVVTTYESKYLQEDLKAVDQDSTNIG